MSGYRIFLKLKIIILKVIFKCETMNLELDLYRYNGATIGENVRAFSKITAAEPYLISIGNDVTISSEVKFTTHDNSVEKFINGKTDLFGKISIGNNCFIGRGTIFLPGIKIPNRTIVAAGSVVTKSFKEEGIIIGGNPAKKIGYINKYIERYQYNAISVKGLHGKERRKYILRSENKFIEK